MMGQKPEFYEGANGLYRGSRFARPKEVVDYIDSLTAEVAAANERIKALEETIQEGKSIIRGIILSHRPTYEDCHCIQCDRGRRFAPDDQSAALSHTEEVET